MGTRHLAFSADEVERIWVLAANAWVVDEVAKLAVALRDEIRFEHHRVDRQPAWPARAAIGPMGGRLAEAALQIATFRSHDAVDGPLPEGFHPIGDWDGCTLSSRRRAGLELALSWEVPEPVRTLHDG